MGKAQGREEITVFISNALDLMEKSKSECVFLFLNFADVYYWFFDQEFKREQVVLVIPQDLMVDCDIAHNAGVKLIRSWSGNQSRFSRIKYSFMHGVLEGFITAESKVICVLGPWGTSHLDTLTVHDLSFSWSEEFPFDPRTLIGNQAFGVVLAMVDIAMDIGASGREGKAVGTSFVVGDTDAVLAASHQAVFNPFKGYGSQERHITRSEVVESIKELAQLDGAIIVSEDGFAVAAGRHLDVSTPDSALHRGLGARHRAASGITSITKAVAIVISESSGKITIYENGKTIATLEPVTGRRLV